MQNVKVSLDEKLSNILLRVYLDIFLEEHSAAQNIGKFVECIFTNIC